MSAADLDAAKLPNALRMTYRVIDAAGKTLALSNDLGELQQTFAERSRGAVASVAQKTHSPIERDALTSWDFDALEQNIVSEHGGNVVRAFPALVAFKTPGKTVAESANIRLFATESEQTQHHAGGVVALVKAAIASPAKDIEAHLSQAEKLAIASLPYSTFTAFIDDIIVASAERELRKINADGLIFTRPEFEKVRDAVSANIVEDAFVVARQVNRIAVAVREANKAISEVNALNFLTVLSGEKAHIAELLHAGFISGAGLDRLPRLVVYLQAIKQRIEKLQENPGRDQVAIAEFNQALGIYSHAGGLLPLAPNSSSKLIAARWLLEELRVSLFAQGLGTAETVSVQRIKKALS